MALLLAVVFDGPDGGLATLLADARVPAPAIAWITGEGPHDLGCDHMSDFLSSFGAGTFESEIEDRLKAAQVPDIKDNARMLNQSVARLRHAFRSATAAAAPAPPAAPPPPQTIPVAPDMDSPLSDTDKGNLVEAWTKRYGVAVQSRLMGCDSLVCRTYREWKAGTPTVADLSRIRNQSAMLKPTQERRERLTADVSIVHHIDDTCNSLDTTYQYYVNLRILVNVWAFVGNYEVPSTQRPESKILMMDLEAALNYADNALDHAQESGHHGAAQLAWLRANDTGTRTTMMEKCGRGCRQLRRCPTH